MYSPKWRLSIYSTLVMHKLPKLKLLWLAALAAMLGTSSAAFTGQCAQNATCPSDRGSNFTVATFNLLMDEFSPLREERIPVQIEFLSNNSNFDVICLQELWNSSIRSRILDALSTKYPFQIVQPNVAADLCPSGAPACNEAELRSIARCFAGPPCNNPALSSLELIACITASCLTADVLDSLSGGCRECLSFSSSGFSIDSRLRNCAGLIETSDTNIFTSCQTIYNGSVDTVILSKNPILQHRFDKFRASPVWTQGSLFAQIQATNNSVVDIFCTHPVTDFPLVNFEKTNLDQARNLIQIVSSQQNSTNSTNSLSIVLGDFNSGPKINERDTANPALNTDVKSLFPDSFSTLQSAGWQDTLTLVGTRTCTWCPDQNPLAKNGPFWLDHIFVASNASNSCLKSSSIFANQSIVPAPSQAGPVPLSDHFGVQATFCLA